MQLINQIKIASAITPTAGAAAQTAIEGSIIDTANFEGVLFMLRMGAITTGAVTSLKVRQSASADMSSPEDLAESAQTIGDGDDGEIFYVDIYRPAKRYLQLYVSRGTQDAVVASAEALPYGPRVSPVTQPTGTNGESLVSPAAGTA